LDPLIALMITPLLIWGGVFAFVWFVDRRVRSLERLVRERKASATPSGYDRDAVSDKEIVSR
jgi:CcmD family protein